MTTLRDLLTDLALEIIKNERAEEKQDVNDIIAAYIEKIKERLIG